MKGQSACVLMDVSSREDMHGKAESRSRQDVREGCWQSRAMGFGEGASSKQKAMAGHQLHA